MALKISRSFITFSLNRFPYLVKPPICFIISTHFLSSSIPIESNYEIRASDHLINQHQFSSEIPLRVSSRVPCVKDSEKSDSILSFFKESGFSKSQIEKIVKTVPRVLCASLDNTIKPKIKIFQDLGFSSIEISEIIAFDPWVLCRSANNQIAPSIMILKRIFGSQAEVCRMLRISGRVFNYTLEKTMMPNIEFLTSCGISLEQIRKSLFTYPRFFLYKPEMMKCYVKRVDDMGFDRTSKMYFYAIRTVSSMSVAKWEKKLHLFRSLGFSEDDILSSFKRHPQVFAISDKKIMEVTQLLLNSGTLDISSLVKYPDLLIYSVECRLKPRVKVFKMLVTKNLLQRKISVTTVLKASDKNFLNRYVVPYSRELRVLGKASEGSFKLPKSWIAVLGTPHR